MAKRNRGATATQRRKRKRQSKQAQATTATRATSPALSAAARPVTERLQVAYQLLCSGQRAQAHQAISELLTAHPDNADAWHLLGLWLHTAGEHLPALEALDQAIRLNCQANATILCTRGSILSALSRHRESVEMYRQAMRIDPQLVEPRINLATAALALHDYEAAVKAARGALGINPDHPQALASLSAALLRQGHLKQAHEVADQAVHKAPGNVSSWLNLGIACKELGRLQEAFQAFQRATEIDTSCAAGYHNMGHVLVAYGRISDAVACFRAAKQLDDRFASDYLFTLSHDDTADPHFVCQEHHDWGRALECRVPRCPARVCRDTNRRLRIGYVSPDFRQHAMARYLLPVFQHQDRSAFELFAYSDVPRADSMTDEFQQLADHWRETTTWSDAEFVHAVQQDKIDILVDLAGHTAGNRLTVFAHKPAPLQITWLGYSNTTGLRTIDYRLTNAFQDSAFPDSHGAAGKAHTHAEKLHTIPGEGVCYTPPADAPNVGPLPANQNGYITFGSLHRLNKLTPPTIALWSQVLHAVPGSKLRLFWPTLTGERQTYIRRSFQSHGIASDRLLLRHDAGSGGYLNQYQQIDIGLDPFPWTGSTTTREALWMGVVVLAYCGVPRSARGSAAVLHYAGLDEFIARQPQEYVALATRTANSWDRLAQLRSTLRQQLLEKLGTPAEQVRRIEDAYQHLWQALPDQLPA